MSDRAVHDRTTSLRTEMLALLLEPLGVDAMAGQAALRWLAENVHTVAQACGCSDLPPSGSTLPWVSEAVAACVEEHELVRLAMARGGTPTLGEARALRELAHLEGLLPRLRTLDGVPVDALRADLAAVAVAERLLPEVLEPCSRADQDWPEEIWQSIREIDVDSALADLSRPRITRQAAAARELVLQHSISAARDLRNRDLATRLEKVRDFVAAEKAYEAFLSVRPGWWRWLGPDARSGFRSDRRDALVWAIEARDTGAVPGSALELLAADDARAVIEHAVTASVAPIASLSAPPAKSSAARLVTGLLAVASRHDADQLRALESWYTRNAALFDRVAAAMDVRGADPGLREALDPLVGELALPSGAVDTSRSDYRDIQSALRAEVQADLKRTPYSEHAMESEDLVGVISRIGTLERELRDAIKPLPPVRGRLLVAIAGRTKSGKTTLRKALTRDADRTGIGRGAHRTTRKTSTFDIGSVTYLDTPGVAAKDDDFDAQHARAACDIADAVIWNYADTLREEESAELQRLLLSGKPLLAVVNVKGLVNTPVRLELFADRPNREFKSAAGHAARIEQVATAVGVAPPVILAVHSGAAHEALSTEDRELADKALRASRLPDLERSLEQLLAERAIPLRAVRLAEGVRTPLAAIHGRLIEELPRIDLALGELERSAPSEQAGLLEAFRTVGRNTRDRLEAERHRAKERLPEVVRELGGADHAQRWSDFVTGLKLEALVSSLECELERETRKRGKVLRARASAPDPQEDEHLEVRPRPDAKAGSVSAAAAKGAGAALLGSVAAKGIPKKLAPPPVVVADYVLTPLAGAAKAVSGEVDRLRQAREEWSSETTAAAEARLDEVFGGREAQVARIVDDTTTQVGVQFEAQFADIARTRGRFRQLRQLRSGVRSALDAIDLVLVRRLLALAGGDPATVRSARRTPGVELRVWTDASSVADVRACLQERLVDVLTERIEIRSAHDGNTDD
ncbi:GTPase [Streptomyces sp. NPDC085995]|uniref:GTPase n=1 Tax=Streptomyces sp. NPDC085995 TaxID=3154861 RepID=UPI00341D5305